MQETFVQSYVENLEKELKTLYTENGNYLREIAKLKEYQAQLLLNFNNLGAELCDSCKNFDKIISCLGCKIQFCATCSCNSTKCQHCNHLYCQECILDQNPVICDTCHDFLCTTCFLSNMHCKTCKNGKWTSNIDLQ